VGNNRDQQANGSDVETLQEDGSRDATGDNIVAISSGHNESGSSLSPVPSEYDEDGLDSSYSSRSTSSDGRNSSVDHTAIGEDFDIGDDIGDYNNPPRPPSTTSSSGADSEPGTRANEIAHMNSYAGPGRSPSAVEGLRAIQAELIPGYYEEVNSRDEQSTRGQTRSDPLLLFPGLSTRSMHEEDSDVSSNTSCQTPACLE
jgi:hypothetical protein